MQAIQEPASCSAEHIEGFITHCTARNLSPNSVRAYRSDLRDFLEIVGSVPITRNVVRAFALRIGERGITATSIYRKIAAVKTFCGWLESQGLLDAGTVDSITKPRRRQELPDVPTEDEIRTLLDGEIKTACPARDRLVLELLYGCGLRVAELAGINIEDFQGEDVLLVRGKGRKERLVIVGEYARRALNAWLKERDVLLKQFNLQTNAMLFSVAPNRSEERIDVRSVRRILQSVAASKGLDPTKWHPHLLRHCCGPHMHDHDAPLQAVAAYLGHAKLSTAQIYTRVSVGRMMRIYKGAHPHAA